MITFIPLQESHFPLLLKWRETPHIKKWWDEEIDWTSALIKAKYEDYVQGYKVENGTKKPMKASIICIDLVPIGYIQIYNAYDFLRAKPLIGLPLSLAALDLYIGDEKYLNKGLGPKVIAEFLAKYGTGFTHAFVDPDSDNIAAIRAYEKAGFLKMMVHKDTREIWMVREI